MKDKINNRINDELWLEHFANALYRENAIDEKTYKKLKAKILIEINRKYKNS